MGSILAGCILIFAFCLSIYLLVCGIALSQAFKKITLIEQMSSRYWINLPIYEMKVLKPLDIYVPLSASKISKTSKLEVLGVLGENCIC